jgi:hypothetical protein
LLYFFPFILLFSDFHLLRPFFLLFLLHFPFFPSLCPPLSLVHLTLRTKQRELIVSDRTGMNQFGERFEPTAATGLLTTNGLTEPRGRLPAGNTGRITQIKASVRYSDFNNTISPTDVT